MNHGVLVLIVFRARSGGSHSGNEDVDLECSLLFVEQLPESSTEFFEAIRLDQMIPENNFLLTIV